MGLLSIPNLTLKGNQNQHLALTQVMQRSLHVLQLPTLELAEFLEQEIADNPALERLDSDDESSDQEEYQRKEEGDFSKTQEQRKIKDYQESLITYHASLFEHLMNQAKESFLSEEDLNLAEEIIGNLNEKGYYTQPILDDRTHAALSTIQTFDPPGIAARNLQDSLLIQLQQKGESRTREYALVSKYFDALLKNRRPFLQKKLNLSPKELSLVIKELATLNFHPTSHFTQVVNPPIIPDLILDYVEEKWEVRINDEPIPLFRLSPSYKNFSATSSEDKKLVRRYLASGKWLFRILHKRESTLRKITEYLIKKREPFLLGNTRSLAPLQMRELAQLLDVHESTITRAIANKYIYCPAGLLSLRSFFSEERKSAKTLLKDLISKENKGSPFSDEILSRKITSQGFSCARRTVAKYRKQLNIPPQSLRRK